MLHKIFAFQAQLMDKLAPVEKELGYTPPQIPLDFTKRAAQDWFRLMSWYLTEEMVEALNALPEDEPEELADCIHFAVELCILADITASQVESLSNTCLFDHVPQTYELQDVLISLGSAVNMLKAKHWKRNPKPVHMENFRFLLAQMLFRLLKLMTQRGMNPSELYFAKHQKNEQRIQDKY